MHIMQKRDICKINQIRQKSRCLSAARRIRLEVRPFAAGFTDFMAKRGILQEMKRTYFHLWFSAFLFCMAVTPPIFADSSPTTLRIGTAVNQTEALLPIHQVPGQSHFLRNFIAPPFIHLDPDWRWQCRICLHLPSSAQGANAADPKQKAGSSQPTTSQWEISPQMNWADGTNVTGYDVQYTINHLRKSQKDPSLQENFPVKEITVDPQNPRKFSLTVKHFFTDSYQILAISLLPAHKRDLLENPKESVETHGNSLIAQPFWSYGPYRIANISGNEVTLVPNEHYSGSALGWKKIVLQYFPKKADLLRALKTGAIDMIADGELGLDDISLLSQDTKTKDPTFEQVRVLASPSNELEQITLNLRNPAFGDVRLRKALLVGMNRQRIVADIYHNHALVADYFLHPKDPLFVKPKELYAYKPDVAATLLDDAGWKLAANGKRVKNDHVLALQIASRPETVRMRVIGLIKEDWQKLGIDVTVEEIADSESFHEYVQSARFRDMAYYTWMEPPGSIPWSQLHSGQIPGSRNEYVGQNAGAWSNSNVDAALNDLLFEEDPKDRQKSINTILNEWASDIPIIPIVFRPRFAAFAADLPGYLLPGNGYHSSIYCEQWRPADEIPSAK